MPLINTNELTPETFQPPNERLQTYCAFDCCLTVEVFEEISRIHPEENLIYNFERALQGPYMEIMQRGFLVDEFARREASEALRVRMQRLDDILQQLAFAATGSGLNYNSPKQMQEFFYKKLGLPEVILSKKGIRRVSTDREALEKLDEYLYARPIVALVLALRDYKKQRDVFETEIDYDKRFRAGYNIAGTETGRPSSSTNAFGTASNAQNIDPNLRFVFVADPGKRMCVIDLSQVEARDVGFFQGCLFDDWKFLDNCESGDLHTNNCKLIWPELTWTGEPKADRVLADGNFYREFSYRDMSKRGGHLSNYLGTAWTAARSLKVPIGVMEEFQSRYCRGEHCAFPGHQRWWQWTATQLQTTHQLVTPFGRKRHFFGRAGDDTTLREAIAFLPQSTTADRMNLGMWKVWKAFPEIQLLAQTYDSITFQFFEREDEQELVGRVLEMVESIELIAPNGRKYRVPGEAKVGWNWGAQVTNSDLQKAIAAGRRSPRLNLDGLVKWNPSKLDTRVRSPTGLQRIIT